MGPLHKQFQMAALPIHKLAFGGDFRTQFFFANEQVENDFRAESFGVVDCGRQAIGGDTDVFGTEAEDERFVDERAV